jgi:hypothetical protein
MQCHMPGERSLYCHLQEILKIVSEINFEWQDFL